MGDAQERVLTSAASNIEDDFALEQGLVVVDKVTVRVRPDGVLKHGLMNI